MKKYTAKPHTAAGKYAWAAFTAAIGATPKCMYWCNSAELEWAWIAETDMGSFFVYKPCWSEAAIHTGKITI